MRCPACAQGELTPFLSLARVPVFCNVLWPSHDEARRATTGDIELGCCAACGLLHNTRFDPACVAYSPDYENSLHFSPHFQAYARQLVARLVEHHRVRDKTVVEIGCGKGEFLAMLCEAGNNRGIGFDRSCPTAEPHPRVQVVREGFDPHRAPPADLVCARHVLEHVGQPQDFLAAVRQAASQRDGCLVYFEVPDALWTLRDLGIWDVIYEHCSYYSAPALERLFTSAGFRILATYSAFDGQFLCIEAVVGEALAPADPRVEEVCRLATGFGAQFTAKVTQWRQRLADLAADGKRVALWGAGSKGVTFLNRIPDSTAIGLVIDLNPRKHGRFVPGTGHRVEAPEALPAFQPDAVLVMNPAYAAEIAAHCRRLGVGDPAILTV